MTSYLATMSLASTSGLAEDRVTNSFAFSAPDIWSPTSEVGEVVTAINALFNTNTPTSGSKLSDYLGASISEAASAHTVDIYDLTGHLDGSPHGSPVASSVFTTGSIGLDELPREVAFVATLRAIAWQTTPVEAPDGSDPGTAIDRPRQRRTGRMYFGPLASAAAGVLAANSRPHASFMTTVREAINAFHDSLVTNGLELCVWSRRDELLRSVTHVETDDAWDTQRSRGVAPTARISLAV